MAERACGVPLHPTGGSGAERRVRARPPGGTSTEPPHGGTCRVAALRHSLLAPHGPFTGLFRLQHDFIPNCPQERLTPASPGLLPQEENLGKGSSVGPSREHPGEAPPRTAAPVMAQVSQTPSTSSGSWTLDSSEAEGGI